MLLPIDDDIWLVEGTIVDFHGFPYPTRSVVVRLANGALWIWSPIALTDDLAAAVDDLGPVRHLVSPNKIHHLFLGAWHDAYPEAQLWGPESTIRKRRDLAFAGALGDEPPASWATEIDQAWFRGSPFMDEVVFCHRPSRTAIFADLSENFSQAFLKEHWSGWARALAHFCRLDQGYAPLEWRLSFVRRGPAREALCKVLSWSPERVVMAHGEWQAQDGKAYIERVFAWL